MSELILHPNTEELNNLITESNVLLVDFWAAWCGPCKMLAPVIDSLAERFKDRVKLAKVNVDEERELAMQYNIQSIPTVLIFKEGKLITTEMGYQPEDVYAGILESLLD